MNQEIQEKAALQLICGGKSSWWRPHIQVSLTRCLSAYSTLGNFVEHYGRTGGDVHAAVGALSVDPEYPAALHVNDEGPAAFVPCGDYRQIREACAENAPPRLARLDLDAGHITYRPPGERGGMEMSAEADVLLEGYYSYNSEDALLDLMGKEGLRWDREHRRSAVYRITDGGEAAHYFTTYAGMHFNALVLRSILGRAGSELHQMGLLSDVNRLVPLVPWRREMLAADFMRDTPLLTSVSARCADGLNNCIAHDHMVMGMSVDMDFDRHTLTFTHSPLLPLPDLALTFEQAQDCLEAVLDELCQQRHLGPEKLQVWADTRVAVLSEELSWNVQATGQQEM